MVGIEEESTRLGGANPTGKRGVYLNLFSRENGLPTIKRDPLSGGDGDLVFCKGLGRCKETRGGHAEKGSTWDIKKASERKKRGTSLLEFLGP